MEKEEILDKWQQQAMEHKGNLILRAGRQSGKSFIVSKKVYWFSRTYEETVTLVIAPAQRQSSYLFQKIKGRFRVIHDQKVRKAIAQWQSRNKKQISNDERWKIEKEVGVFDGIPTQTYLKLKDNGSELYCLPSGRTGDTIRCYTIDLLVADEAPYIAEQVWNAVLPMVAVSRKERGFGWIFLLGTPFGKGGYYYECCLDKDFLHIHVTSEQCSRIDKKFLMKEKGRMSKLQYAQEYLAEFVDDYSQYFRTPLIKSCCSNPEFRTWEYKTDYLKDRRYFLGVDVARFGGDENAFAIAEMDSKGNLRIVKVITTKYKAITDTVGRIKAIDEKFRFNRIFIDDGGIGGGVYDDLAEAMGTRRVVGINNASRSVSADGKRVKILKEDIYSHTLVLMEHYVDGKSPNLQFVPDLDIQRSLRSITFEYTSEGRLKIYGKNSHITEAIVRACWGLKEKGLKLFVASF